MTLVSEGLSWMGDLLNTFKPEKEKSYCVFNFIVVFRYHDGLSVLLA